MKGLVFVLDLYGGQVEEMEQRAGLKGLTLQTSSAQFIETKSGMKGLSFHTEARGSVIKITHAR